MMYLRIYEALRVDELIGYVVPDTDRAVEATGCSQVCVRRGTYGEEIRMSVYSLCVYVCLC